MSEHDSFFYFLVGYFVGRLIEMIHEGISDHFKNKGKRR